MAAWPRCVAWGLQYPNGLRVDDRYDPNDRLIWLRASTAGEVEFDELRCRARVIHLDAPPALRTARLRRRTEPPEVTIEGQTVRVAPSDDHRLPGTPNRNRYDTHDVDDVDQLAAAPRWRDKVFRMTNGTDDGGARVDTRLHDFIDQVIVDYTCTHTTAGHPPARSHR